MKDKFKKKGYDVDKVLEISSEVSKNKDKDGFAVHACEFKNEDDCEEEVEEDGKEIIDLEKEHYEEEGVEVGEDIS